SDYLTHRFDPVLTAGVAGVVCLIALVLQFSMRRYLAWIYWFAVAMVSVFGTMVADALHVGFGIPYAVSTAGFALMLSVVFIAWYSIEKTLSIHSIFTRRREMFYWAAILTTFAFGTAAGDLTATTVNLGYLGSGLLFAVLIAIPAVGHWRFHLNAVFAFWFAYVLTRPLGASFADWIAVPASRGGLDWGTGPITLVLLLMIVACVGYLASTGQDVATPQTTTEIQDEMRGSKAI
ncbi:MAG: hypothetical protein ABJD68_19710, partial [Nakamurella sp.]